jgi:hypothetical protein
MCERERERERARESETEREREKKKKNKKKKKKNMEKYCTLCYVMENGCQVHYFFLFVLTSRKVGKIILF